jgi:hypothetical protein
MIQSPAQPQLKVMYERLSINIDSYPNFPIPTCMDLGAVNAHLVLNGPDMKDVMTACETGQFSFDPVTAGTYQATLELLDGNGAPITKKVMSMMVDVQPSQMPTIIDIVFKQSDYLKSYTGNFDFMPWWGALNTTCSQGSVNKETLTLTPAGMTTPVMMVTRAGNKLNGMPGTCFVQSTGNNYDEVTAMPWGFYDLTVTGLANGNMVTYCQKFQVFVAIGVATPTYDLVVAPVGTGDGGACP